jgi:succinoglycan biosynthesis transport protein ExoP
VDSPPQPRAGVSRDESRSAHARSRFESGRATHLLDRLNVIYKYHRVAVSVFLLVVLASLLRTYTTTPLYRAQARLMIELEDERTVAVATAISTMSDPVWRDPEIYYQTQNRILAGRETARRAVQRLDLGHVAEFSGAGAPPTRLRQTLSTLKAKTLAPVARFFGSAPVKGETAASAAPESSLIGQFMGRVSVEPVPNSHLVDVGFVSADPAFAVLAVNTLAEEYVKQNLELRRQNMVSSLEWLSQELVKQQKKVEDSERAMAQYREEQNALSLEDRQNIVVARLTQLNDAVTRAKTNRVQKEALYDQIKNLDADVSADTIPAILQNPYIQATKTRLAELQRERAMLLERYGEKYPDVLKANASYQDVSRQLQTELAKAIAAIRNDYESAAAEERTLATALEEQKAAAMDLNRKSVSYTVLEREAHSNRQVYETLLQREKELQVMANSRGNNVRMTDPAEKPGAPFVPTPRRDLLLAIVAGLGLSLGLVLFLDYLDDTVKNPDDLTGELNLPLLGLAPTVPDGRQSVLSPGVPHEFAEAFRSLRTSLNFSSGLATTRLLMVTSAQPLEGKTTIASNLALVLAINGARVLLIDADMRRPGVHRMLTIENGIGLSHVLTGQAAMDDALVALENPRLWVMTAGVPPPNPSELLGSDRMRSLLDEMKSGRFDWVVFDTPPVLPVTDAVVLSAVVDGVAFVIGSEMTQRQHVARAVETLARGGSRMFGAILNKVNLERNRYYYSRYYGYKNRNYYFTPPAT